MRSKKGWKALTFVTTSERGSGYMKSEHDYMLESGGRSTGAKLRMTGEKAQERNVALKRDYLRAQDSNPTPQPQLREWVLLPKPPTPT